MRTVEPLGRRFFWVKSTGNIVAQRNEMSAGIESTKEEDFAVYVELKPYEPDAIEMTTFEPGQYAEEFATASSWRFNPDTGEIEFAYPDPTNPEQPPVYQPPLTAQVAELKAETAALNLAIIDVWETLAGGGV
ncbi:hypothetical protein JNUCC32_31145 (plasmid) [Paenibacillus sp. JNUCC32]|uniref:hypothetical protein n=1 Tax=Paenibacillus sp. JNUCC32 TaxID=2777984 RepID=UPI001787E0C5|nr:hypothetical protein [Paenibacillus sp. JNUCC-32]QOT13744.1 hypothetical protein JNUCC32_31145 [Paenibacillus sp. JNUCC-32]